MQTFIHTTANVLFPLFVTNFCDRSIGHNGLGAAVRRVWREQKLRAEAV